MKRDSGMKDRDTWRLVFLSRTTVVMRRTDKSSTFFRSKTYIYECRCDERLLLKSQNWGIYTSWIHWVVQVGRVTGTPKDRDEVNRREVVECDGWVCDLEAPSIFRVIRNAAGSQGPTPRVKSNKTSKSNIPQNKRNCDVCPSNGSGLSDHWTQSGG
jgi:hypothetical protein